MIRRTERRRDRESRNQQDTGSSSGDGTLA